MEFKTCTVGDTTHSRYHNLLVYSYKLVATANNGTFLAGWRHTIMDDPFAPNSRPAQ